MEKEQFPLKSEGVVIRKSDKQDWVDKESTKPVCGGKYAEEYVWVKFDRPVGSKNLCVIWFQKLPFHQKRRQNRIYSTNIYIV